MTLQLLHSEFPYIWGNFDFLFYQCRVKQLDAVNVTKFIGLTYLTTVTVSLGKFLEFSYYFCAFQ
jgi:hypothetical protein